MSQPQKTTRWPWIVGGIAALLLLVIGIANDGTKTPAAPGAFTVPTAQVAPPTSSVVLTPEEEVNRPGSDGGSTLEWRM